MKKIAQVKLSDEYIVNMHQVLGKGSTGCVYQGRSQKNNEKVAVKVIELSTIDNEVTQYLLKMQKKALQILQSPYVLKGLRTMQDQKFCFLVTQYCNGGTLKKRIKDQGHLSEQKSLKIIKQLLLGYSNLVQKQVVHRDLKPANIMLHNDIPKIIDFGYCQINGYQKPNLEYNVGSPSYMAPESYNLNLYNEKTQVWSIGMILYECLTGRTIDQGRKMEQTYQAMQLYGITFPNNISQKTKDIVNSCLSLNARRRPTCQQLLNKYFNQSYQQSYKTSHSKSFLTNNNGGIAQQSYYNSNINTKDKQIITQKEYLKQNRSSTPQAIGTTDKVSLFNSDVNDKFKYAKIITQQTQRINNGILTNPHQQIMNKNIQNRVKQTYSTYQGNRKTYQPFTTLSNMENFRNSYNQMPKVQPNLMKRTSLPISNPIQNDYGLTKNINMKTKDNLTQNEPFKNFSTTDYTNYNVNAHLYLNPYFKNIRQGSTDNINKPNNPFSKPTTLLNENPGYIKSNYINKVPAQTQRQKAVSHYFRA